MILFWKPQLYRNNIILAMDRSYNTFNSTFTDSFISWHIHYLNIGIRLYMKLNGIRSRAD